MAVGVGTVTNAPRAFNNGQTTAHVVDVADDRVLLVWIYTNNPGFNVNTCTWGGVPMTELIDINNVGGNDARVQLYYLVAPVEAAANVVYTLAGNCHNFASCQSWAGVDPVEPFGVPVTNTGNTALITVTVGSNDNEVVVDGGAYVDNAVGIVLGAGQTSMYTVVSDGTIGGGSSYEVGAAANVMTWTLGGVCNWATGAVALRPFIPFASRLFEYEFNVWDPLQRLIGRDGHEVSPNEVRADKWGKLLGFRSPSSKVYASLADSPDAWYTSGVTSDGESVRITPDEKLFADMILKRITR